MEMWKSWQYLVRFVSLSKVKKDRFTRSQGLLKKNKYGARHRIKQEGQDDYT